MIRISDQELTVTANGKQNYVMTSRSLTLAEEFTLLNILDLLSVLHLSMQRAQEKTVSARVRYRTRRKSWKIFAVSKTLSRLN